MKPVKFFPIIHPTVTGCLRKVMAPAKYYSISLYCIFYNLSIMFMFNEINSPSNFTPSQPTYNELKARVLTVDISQAI